MKFKVYHLCIFLAFVFTTNTSAQVDRRIAPGQYKRAKSQNEKYDLVAETVKYYKKEFSLDDFQAAAVKEIISSEKEAITTLREQQGITKEEMRDRANAINERIDAKIEPMLSKDQLKKYIEFKEKRKG